jgi:tRNA (Thr-GGU) A37 N-methylase
MLTLTPIGTVRNEIKTPILQGWGTVVSDLVLDEGYTEGLDGIEDYSHVIVIFWMDQAVVGSLPHYRPSRTSQISERPCTESRGFACCRAFCSSWTIPS